MTKATDVTKVTGATKETKVKRMKDKTDKGYHRLIIWKKAYELIIEIYTLTKKLPRTEEFGLTSQIRRAAVSVVLNIVEGHRRAGNKEFLHFLNISRSSLTEIEASLEICRGLQYIDEAEFTKLDNKINELSYLIDAFITSLRKRPQ